MGRPLTDDYYRGQISVRNAALLECILESFEAWTSALGPGSPGPPEPTRPADPWAASQS